MRIRAMKKQSQFKANFRKAKMNVNSLITKDYRKKDDFAVQKNKANSKPIPQRDTQYAIRDTRYKPNFKPNAPTGPLRNFYFLLYSIYPI